MVKPQESGLSLSRTKPLYNSAKQYRRSYQEAGPKVSPSASCFWIAVPKLSIVLKAPLLPHQVGNSERLRPIAAMMTMVQMARPVSNAADVM